jgi:DNA-binding PadR family transcriptional regulator
MFSRAGRDRGAAVPVDGARAIANDYRYSDMCYSCRRMRPSALSRDTLHILIAVADRERHGYAILQDVRERTDGHVLLSPSTLYSAIRRLLEEGLIEELDERPDPDHDDERRRYYRITKAGRQAVAEEARQLQQLLADARATGLLSKRA